MDKEVVKNIIKILEKNEQKLKNNSKSLGRWKNYKYFKNKYIDLIYKLKNRYLSLEQMNIDIESLITN